MCITLNEQQNEANANKKVNTNVSVKVIVLKRHNLNLKNESVCVHVTRVPYVITLVPNVQ